MTAIRLRPASWGMIVAALSCLFGMVNVAQASCGDHLAETGIPATIRAGEFESPQQLPIPCHGPQCRNQPESPTSPPVPTLQLVVRELFVQTDEAVIRFVDGIESSLCDVQFADSTCWGQRLERPPRVA